MPAEVIIPALAGALDSIFGFGSNQAANKTNMRMNRENLAAAKEMQNTQMQFQKDMYEDAKMYNSPLNQRRLNEAAGLNPFQTLGEGSFSPAVAQTGASGSVPSMNPVHAYQPNLSAAASTYFDSRMKQEQIESMRYQNDMKELTYQMELQDKIETIMNKRVKTDIDYQNLRMLRQEYEILLKTKNYRISQSRADANRAQAEADSLDFQNFMNHITASLDYAIKNNEYNISSQAVQQNEAAIAAAWQNVKNLSAEGALTNKLIKKTSQEITSIILKNEHDKQAYPKLRRQIEAQIRATNRFSRKQGPVQYDVQYNEGSGEYEFITPSNKKKFGATRHR